MRKNTAIKDIFYELSKNIFLLDTYKFVNKDIIYQYKQMQMLHNILFDIVKDNEMFNDIKKEIKRISESSVYSYNEVLSILIDKIKLKNM